MMKNKSTPTTFLVLCSSLLASCISVGEPAREAIDFSSGSRSADAWDQVFAGRSSITRFQEIHTGQVEVPLKGMLNLDHPTFEDEEAMAMLRKLVEVRSPDGWEGSLAQATVYVDVYAYFFCHELHGCYLIDSGLDSSFGAGKPGNIHGLLADSYILSSKQDPGMDILAQLQRIPEAAEGLEGIFLTHLHGDHSSGLPAITGSREFGDTRVIAARDEPYINYPLLYRGDHLAGTDKLYTIDPGSQPSMPVVGPSLDVFGDGSLWAIHTPGHSASHISFLIRTSTGDYLIVGDASHTRLGFDLGVEPGWVDDRTETVESLSRLRLFAEKYRNVQVLYGHDR
jgi:N-acyl homoserine lactone hydrolase